MALHPADTLHGHPMAMPALPALQHTPLPTPTRSVLQQPSVSTPTMLHGARGPSSSFSSSSTGSDNARLSFTSTDAPAPAEGPSPLSSENGTAKADRFAHTRTKRKRTSREDFAILEAAYLANSRPDKAARQAVVERVSLSDKEVQIWFQNRRQMTRRKCRTWQPNAVTAIIRTDEHCASFCSLPDARLTSSKSMSDLSLPPLRLPELTRTHVRAASLGGEPMVPERPSKSGRSPLSELLNPSEPSSATLGASTVPTESRKQSLTLEIEDDEPTLPEHPLKRERSIRLSLGNEGKAQVIMNSDTPSPPEKLHPDLKPQRPPPVMRRSLVRTQSAGQSGVQGHARDGRAFTLHCDKETVEAICSSTETLPHRGSAQGAIALLRNQVNAASTANKRKDANVGQSSRSKPKLARTSSSYARLQSSTSNGNVQRLAPTGNAKSKGLPSKLNAKDTVEIWEDMHPGDSDKENWTPGSQARAGARLLARSSENARAGSHPPGLSKAGHDTSLNVKPAVQGGAHMRTPVQEGMTAKGADEADKENTRSADGEGTSNNSGADLDAVQNLLSLSQGAWA